MDLVAIIAELSRSGTPWIVLVLVAVVGLLAYIVFKQSNTLAEKHREPKLHTETSAAATTAPSFTFNFSRQEPASHNSDLISDHGSTVFPLHPGPGSGSGGTVEPDRIADLIAKRAHTSAQEHIVGEDDEKYVAEILAKKKPGDDFFTFGPKDGSSQ